jgi:hypothetical protein
MKQRNRRQNFRFSVRVSRVKLPVLYFDRTLDEWSRLFHQIHGEIRSRTRVPSNSALSPATPIEPDPTQLSIKCWRIRGHMQTTPLVDSDHGSVFPSRDNHGSLFKYTCRRRGDLPYDCHSVKSAISYSRKNQLMPGKITNDWNCPNKTDRAFRVLMNNMVSQYIRGVRNLSYKYNKKLSELKLKPTNALG